MERPAPSIQSGVSEAEPGAEALTTAQRYRADLTTWVSPLSLPPAPAVTGPPPSPEWCQRGPVHTQHLNKQKNPHLIA